MKCLIMLVVTIAVSSATYDRDPSKEYKEGDRFFYFPGDYGGKLVDAEREPDKEFLSFYLRSTSRNDYWLFTSCNPTTADILKLGDTKSIQDSHLNFDKVTVFLVHGWLGSGDSYLIKFLTEAFLKNDDVNVIVLDWSEIAAQNYSTAKAGVPALGLAMGKFIIWLIDLGLSYEKVHLVGFSLGGHLVGNAGRETGGRVKRITSLDPAGPLWYFSNDRIVPTDAEYVEVIHTNAAFYGYFSPCGDVDIYANGGSVMPGCSILNYSCSHNMAWQYFAATVRYNKLIANKCDGMTDVLLNSCSGPGYPMGNSNLNKLGSGIFRVNTEEDWPF